MLSFFLPLIESGLYRLISFQPCLAPAPAALPHPISLPLVLAAPLSEPSADPGDSDPTSVPNPRVSRRISPCLACDAAAKPRKQLAGPAPEKDVERAEAGGARAHEPAAAGGDGASSFPFTPMTLAFKDIDYFVPKPGSKREELQLLSGVTGSFRPGVLTALMGASGAGKVGAELQPHCPPCLLSHPSQPPNHLPIHPPRPACRRL